ncbi:selenium-dependent molybdenum cofactor biosynthesis protein YqeB [Natranaerobius thermophilus]|uniref:Biotin/lipoyl attachment n=1 Tax=Natranaerobius thermophilus (strain ATCC BAA-1301 / DSM 18059 / JW/NM-WN-LF) TaxID=457570 RepID=B2A804_NATTJ|nr:selenium-dependent molybdenum cofactor biosynthesis protein YqeB [Natranaerobius thermophilus]ACB85776.1 biotin/lipoyl attachment [Natranaerobius thermophilus JW/NM-WN-LF]
MISEPTTNEPTMSESTMIEPPMSKPTNDIYDNLVLIKGAGDLATGVAHRLFRAGIPVMMTEISRPTVVRRTVAFAEAVFDGSAQVERVTANLIQKPEDRTKVLEAGEIPLLVDPELNCLETVRPQILVEATLAKKNTGISKDDAPIVIALGPGYIAGQDVDAVVETKRGHYLGRVVYQGRALPNTGVPGEVAGYTRERVLYSPGTGMIENFARIGDKVEAGEQVALVEGQPIRAQVSGVLRGMIRQGLKVKQGMKVGDVDPRADVEHCWTISDKARSVAGGVLEASLALSRSKI